MNNKPHWALPGHEERQAAHFRALASTATTARLKARLLREADKHEQTARGEPVLDVTEEYDSEATSAPLPQPSTLSGGWWIETDRRQAGRRGGCAERPRRRDGLRAAAATKGGRHAK